MQALGKIDVPLQKANIDLCSFSGHKIHGLKGTGILYVRDGVTLFPLAHGGTQEHQFRAGTENVAGNVALVRALRLAMERKTQAYQELMSLQTLLREGLEKLKGVYINSPLEGTAYIMNISIPPLKPEVMIHALYEKGIIVSTKSACSSKKIDTSRVLEAMGVEDAIAKSALRISLTYDTTKEEIEAFLQALQEVLVQLNEIME